MDQIKEESPPSGFSSISWFWMSTWKTWALRLDSIR